ncbi:MAG: sulfite exporter TauE/SafE family protein [Acidimicrobiales bacterium]|nr:sulfite exporter TauE/SafE family protein [Acidimicrobiales bacterium]
MSPAAAVVVVAAVLVAAGVQSFSGFGFALASMPLLVTVLDPADAVVVSNALGLLTSGAQAYRLRAEVERPVARRIGLAVLVGLPLGVGLLVVAPRQAIQVTVALSSLLGVAALTWTRGRRLASPVADVVAGLLCGTLNTATSTGGPPVVLVLQGRGLDPDAFKATISVILVLANVVGSTLLVAAGQVGTVALAAVAISLPALAVGFAIGTQLALRTSPARFRSVVLGLLTVSAGIGLVVALT